MVTGCDVDPVLGFNVATVSHDGFLRYWDIRTGRSMQNIRLHTRCNDEIINCVHHAPGCIITGGADGLLHRIQI